MLGGKHHMHAGEMTTKMMKNWCLRRMLPQTINLGSYTYSSSGRLFYRGRNSASCNNLHHARFYNTGSSLPRQYLDAYDAQKFDSSTHQRNDVLFDPIDGKPPQPSNYSSITKQEEKQDKSSHNFEDSWLESHLQRWRADPSDFDSTWPVSSNELEGSTKTKSTTKRILWSNWTEELVRDRDKSPILFEYDNLIHDKSKNMERRLMKALYQFGLVLITSTPSATDSLPEEITTEETKNAVNANESAEDAILHLASMIGYHPLQTLYGSGVWSTSSYSSFYNKDNSDDQINASTADSAYGSTSLPLHTDMNYISNPPGIQIFLMVQPATAGKTSDQESTKITSHKGQSVYLDGFAAAERLRIENPNAFHLLASTERRYRCIDDEEGWHLEACGPVINALPRENGWGPVTSIRHNDLDRLPDLPPYSLSDDESKYIEFYDELRNAHEAWDNILRRDEMRLVIDLKCGDCVLVSNQRCMHGRYAFDTSSFPRVVMGCYVGMDELNSKWRQTGLLLSC